KFSLVEADRSRVIYNWLQYYSMDSLTREFAENGFSIMERYADTTGTAYHPESPEITLLAGKSA
ncbi:MAG: class I SAM-dependent methyltransferase, partial [Desulfuromonas sp.]